MARLQDYSCSAVPITFSHSWHWVLRTSILFPSVNVHCATKHSKTQWLKTGYFLCFQFGMGSAGWFYIVSAAPIHEPIVCCHLDDVTAATDWLAIGCNSGGNWMICFLPFTRLARHLHVGAVAGTSGAVIMRKATDIFMSLSCYKYYLFLWLEQTIRPCSEPIEEEEEAMQGCVKRGVNKTNKLKTPEGC